MQDEAALRRVGFRAGRALRLADGQAWVFPGPGAVPAGSSAEPDEAALLAAVFEAEDAAERLRAELALAIGLLRSNYDLGPADYARLLSFPADDPAGAAFQQAIHELALEHAGAWLAAPASVPAGGSIRARLGRLVGAWLGLA